MDQLEAIREIVATDADLLLTVSFIRKILSVPETEVESILANFHCFRRGKIPEVPADEPADRQKEIATLEMEFGIESAKAWKTRPLNS